MAPFLGFSEKKTPIFAAGLAMLTANLVIFCYIFLAFYDSEEEETPTTKKAGAEKPSLKDKKDQ